MSAQKILRRAVLVVSVCSSWLLALSTSVEANPARSWTVASADALYDPALHLLVDDDAVAKTMGVAKVIGRPHVPSDPLFLLDEPWEIGRMFFGYGTSVLRDPQTGKLRMYYSVDDSHGRNSAKHVPGTSFMCIAESTDGLNWTKPSLGLYEFQASKENNILYAYQDKKSVGRLVGAVLDDPNEKDSSRRFKMFGYMAAVDGQRGYCIMTSPDGLRWDRKPQFVTREGLDTFLMTWDAARKQWLSIGRLTLPKELASNAAKAWRQLLGLDTQYTRCIAVWEGNDLYNLQGKGYAMKPDEEDGYGAKFQHWGMQPLNYGNQYLGVLLVSSEWGPNPRLYLTSSSDGRTWQHAMRWHEFIPLGGAGRWNGEINCLTINPPIKIGEQIFFYYTGRTSSRAGNAINHPGVAIFKQDRFAGYTANRGGWVLTRPVEVVGPKLYVNFDCIWGEMRVEIRNTSGMPIRGYTADDCVPVRPDEHDKSTRLQVSWKGKDSLQELMGQNVQLRFAFRVGTVYAYRFGE